jgi:hypothetical protein
MKIKSIEKAETLTIGGVLSLEKGVVTLAGSGVGGSREKDVFLFQPPARSECGIDEPKSLEV